ncbi:hypothetical protein [Reyranella sp. CPCC 100927]|nr:hypothetical protein [Reyranella sp. CPCC 100927]
MPSVRVKAMGKPLLLSTSVGLTEKGEPVTVALGGQSRVRAT